MIPCAWLTSESWWIIRRWFHAWGCGCFRAMCHLILAFIAGFLAGLNCLVLIIICRLFLSVLANSHFLRFWNSWHTSHSIPVSYDAANALQCILSTKLENISVKCNNSDIFSQDDIGKGKPKAWYLSSNCSESETLTIKAFNKLLSYCTGWYLHLFENSFLLCFLDFFEGKC